MKSGEIEEINPAAAFVFIGLDPNTSFLGDSVELDKVKFIKTGENFSTSIPGIYTAGDVRAGSTKQVTGAVGEGSTAAMMVRHYMERLQTTRGYRGD